MLARAVHAVIFDYMHARTYVVVVLPKESCPATVFSFVHSNKIDRRVVIR